MKYKYVISYRNNESSSRLRNLIAHIEYLQKAKSEKDIEIFVIEQDSEPSDVQSIKDISYHFLYNSGIFNKSWSYNYAYKINSTSDTFIFCDCDCILETTDFITFLNKYESEYRLKYDVISPNNNKSFSYLSEEVSNNVRLDLSILNTMKRKYAKLPSMLSGGIFLIKGSAYLKTKGFNENFRGWGGEDNAFDNSVKFLNIPHCYLDINVFHLCHEVDKNTPYKLNQPENKKIWELYYTNSQKFQQYYRTINFSNLGKKNKYKDE